MKKQKPNFFNVFTRYPVQKRLYIGIETG